MASSRLPLLLPLLLVLAFSVAPSLSTHGSALARSISASDVSDGDIDRYGSGIANSEAESTAVAVPGAEEHVRRSLQRQQVTCDQNSILVTNRVVSDQGKGTTKVIQLIIKNLCPYDVIGRDFLCYEANDVHVLRDSEALKVALECLKEAGSVTAWGSYPNVARRTASVRELTQVGIKNAEKLAVPSVRNDALFLATVVGTTSILALAGTQLPGDWGFFVPYLVGGISIVVLAVGSVAPGLLQGGIGAMAPVFSDYKDRVLRHEAGHFLLAYLLGLPPVAYSLDIGKEHTNLLDDKLQKKIYSGKLESDDVDRLAVVAMAGMAAEGLHYEQVMGQTADLNSLQRLINRSGLGALTPERQQNLTRWAEEEMDEDEKDGDEDGEEGEKGEKEEEKDDEDASDCDCDADADGDGGEKDEAVDATSTLHRPNLTNGCVSARSQGADENRGGKGLFCGERGTFTTTDPASV
ncbi:unnamed protein product [Closterium sp. NIES-65]|nr:unnamed protein product [Closterium sp. NIES-65]